MTPHFVNSGLLRKDHVAGHGPRGLLVEAEEQMIRAHLVLADQAEPAFLTGNDLLGNDEVT